MEAGGGESLLEHSKDQKDIGDKESDVPRRMQCFNDLFKMCIDVIMSTGSPGQFKKYFQEIVDQDSTAFSTITEQLMSHLRSSIEAEINLMINQEDLEKFFNTLDRIVSESKTQESQAWRPSGDPTEDCHDHLMPVKCSFRDRMKEMLEKIEKENKALEDVVLPKRVQIEENQKQLFDKAQHLKEAAECYQELDFSAFHEQAKTLTHNA